MISLQYRWDVPCYVTAITACVIATVDTVDTVDAVDAVDAGRGVWIRTPTIHNKIAATLVQCNTKLYTPYKHNDAHAVDA